ncbi:LemA family protein [Planctomicrobium sp. SH668]|uniref:LemA family protein n=1 Tax=Planctomicrobium sp. SH668 TaxID=3448126 RepID=UPI003F5CB4BD
MMPLHQQHRRGAIGTAAVIGIVVVGALLVFGAMFVSIGNNLVSLDERTKTQWAQVETSLQRRFDLIPNLVATVKGYAEHEQETLTKITELRSQWGAAKTVDEKAKVAGELEGFLGRLMVISENYPQLKADQGFRDLQVQLEGTENRISVERQRYNETLREYNTKVRQFPASLIAGIKGMHPSDAYFESASGADAAPKVDFK